MDTNTQNKVAAIWARVSTDKQHETSIPTQIDLSREKAKSQGYIIPDDYILSTDRTSLQLNDDSKFLKLYELITKHKISAIFLLDRDRLQAEPLERLSFISLCKENGVSIIPAQGPEMLDSDEGQLIEMVLAIGKKKSVLRAQLGSRQGLHDRVTRDRKPVTFRNAYGYIWKGFNTDEKEKELTLIPDDNWPNAKLIFDLLLDGMGYTHLINELKKRGIPSPSGELEWNKTAISTLIHNPLYAGRYYSLKKEAVKPKKRKGDTYGKSSLVNKPQSDWIYLKEVKIIDPPITWEQRQKILDQVISHMRLSQRHAKHDYLLRGFIFCREHYGKNGRPRTYHGHPKRDTYYYCCPVPGCKNRYLPGAELEDYVKYKVASQLFWGDGKGNIVPKDTLFEKVALKGKNVDNSKKIISGELELLSKKEDRVKTKQIKLEDDRYSDRIRVEIYQALRDKYDFELKGIEKRKNELLEQLQQLEKQSEIYQGIQNLTFRLQVYYADKFLDAEKTPNSVLRDIFTTLDLAVRPTTDEQRKEAIEKAFKGHPEKIKAALESKKFVPQFDIQIGAFIPIASDNPGLDKRNNISYPVYLSPAYSTSLPGELKELALTE